MTNPLFVADLSTLKGKLRLSNLESSRDASAILDEALLEVRVGFLRRLGEARVAVLLAIGFDENPISNTAGLRSLANVTEVNWVRLILLCRLPHLFMDSMESRRAWNEEAPFRERGDKTDDAKEQLQKTITQALEVLAGDETFGTESRIKAFDGTPACDPPAPGDSVGRNLSNVVNNPLFED